VLFEKRVMVAFEDETWAELLPTLWKCWYLRGEQLRAPTPGINRRINVFITLDFATGRLIYSIHRKRRSKEFKYHIRKLMRHAKWKGYNRVIVILDNSPIHRSAESRKFLVHHRSFLKVFKLPKYSPNLNVVERINRRLKRDVCANTFFDNLKELERATRKYLRDLDSKT
jgi:hypothetical protein